MKAALQIADVRDYSRFPAITATAKELDDPRIVSSAARPFLDLRQVDHRTPTRGAIGCALSHFAVWSQGFADPEVRALRVFEDDARASDAYHHYRNDLWPPHCNSLLEEADIVLLGANILLSASRHCAFENLLRVYYFNGTWAYIITRRGFQQLLPRLLPITTHLDHQISDLLISNAPTISCYAFSPQLFDHDFTVSSDVEGDLDCATADGSFDETLDRAKQELAKVGVQCA